MRRGCTGTVRVIDVDLREIKYILSIYRHGSITKAAAELYLTQPALSKFLKNLEQQVGAPLFSRIGNELSPTYLGKRYITYALEIERLQDDCALECADLLGEQAGHLSIAVTFMRGACVLPTVLRRFYAKYPRVQVRLLEEAGLLENHMLSDKGVHLLIGNEKYSKSLMVYEELGREEVVLVTPGSHPLCEQAVRREDCRYPWVDLSLAAGERFLLHPADQTTGQIARNALRQAGIASPMILLETRNASVAMLMASQGMGLAFAPESYAERIRFEQMPGLFSVGKPKTETTLYIAYQKGRYLPSYATYFIALLREELPPT